jgi:hypothetical protein
MSFSCLPKLRERQLHRPSQLLRDNIRTAVDHSTDLLVGQKYHHREHMRKLLLPATTDAAYSRG